MRRFLVMLGVVVVCAAASCVWGATDDAAGKAEQAVRDYEERIEKVSGEIAKIRSDLEELTREMVAGETGRVFVFLKGRASDWADTAVNLTIGKKVVFSRPLTPSEIDVLSRGLPLELLEIRLPAGDHKVALSEVGDRDVKGVELAVKRAKINSWIAITEGDKVEWAQSK